MSTSETSPRTLLRRFIYDFATQDCPDIAVHAEEAYEYAGCLGDFHEGYWAGYADCAVALASTLGRMAPKDIVAYIREVAAPDYAAEALADTGEEGEVPGGDSPRNGLGFWGEDSRFAGALKKA